MLIESTLKGLEEVLFRVIDGVCPGAVNSIAV
jgi:hypothetical protein